MWLYSVRGDPTLSDHFTEEPTTLGSDSLEKLYLQYDSLQQKVIVGKNVHTSGKGQSTWNVK